MSSFEFMNNPIMPGQQNYQNNISPVKQQEMINVPKDDTLVTGGYGFTVLMEEKKEDPMALTLPMEIPNESSKPRRGRRKKEEIEVQEVNSSDIVKAEGSVENTPTIYTYMQTTNMLHETLNQIDMVASELKEELDVARLSRTLKNKHNYIVGLSGSIGTLLNTKASVIREINNAISKSNDLDYRREKDRRASETAANDDKYIMDLYNSFIRNPMGQSNALAPSAIDSAVASINGGGIIRSPLQQSDNNEPITDIGYLNYLSRLTPEQNMMYYEQNPNVKTVVVYDKSNGNKFFQVMDMSTRQVIPNVPVMDNRFMEDTYIDLKTNTATNNNLHESYPVIIINDNIVNEY